MIQRERFEDEMSTKMEPLGLKPEVPQGGILERPLPILALKGKVFGRESTNPEDKVMNKTNQLNPEIEYQSDNYYKRLFGKGVIVTRLGQVNIVHLDNPTKDEIKKRVEETVREYITGDAFFDDCPLCQQLQNHPHDIVYYR